MIDLRISKRGAMELIAHEGAVLEAYRDSVGVWTWGIGITNASGHEVFPRYRNKPQTLTRVLEVYLWALRRYEQDVIEAFEPMVLNEHQLAAAVSFHYNTGGIKRASWVERFKKGDIAGARRSFMNWSKPEEIIPRRRAERDLFFDGKWTGNTQIIIWGVHANGNVNWRDKTTVDARSALDAAWRPTIAPAPAAPIPEPVRQVVEDAAADDRMSTTEIVAVGTGATGVVTAVNETVEAVNDTTTTLMSAGPWVLLGLVTAGFGFYIWRERRRKRNEARAAKAALS